ncbi:MAG: acetoacetate decarboxylase [Gammaproteobacteria bacterium]|nr:acetoacetate decarboxylase [Gammaproteobacteria bacterium]
MTQLTAQQVRERAFSAPLTSPAYPKGPYRFINREFLIITYETDLDALRAVVPEPFKVTEPIVKFEVIRMPDSSGFGDYTESGQVIPVEFNGWKGSYVHSMYLDDLAPIAAGREIWGFPKKFGHPTLRIEKETLIGTLDYDGERIATATMGYKYHPLDHTACRNALETPGFLLKIIPGADGSLQICELVEYALTDVVIKSAYSGPGALDLRPHAMAPLADLPVRKILSAVHILSDVTLPYGKVIHSYLK